MSGLITRISIGIALSNVSQLLSLHSSGNPHGTIERKQTVSARAGSRAFTIEDQSMPNYTAAGGLTTRQVADGLSIVIGTVGLGTYFETD